MTSIKERISNNSFIGEFDISAITASHPQMSKGNNDDLKGDNRPNTVIIWFLECFIMSVALRFCGYFAVYWSQFALVF